MGVTAGNSGTTQGMVADPNTNGVLSGSKWANLILTYSFPTLAAHYEPGYGPEPTTNFAAASAQLQTATRYTLGLVSQYTSLVTTEVDAATPANIRSAISTANNNNTAYAYYPGGSSNSGDVWYGTVVPEYQNPLKGQYAWATVMHEVGHALGLKHGHEAEGMFPAMEAAFDQMAYSIMTYRSYVGAPTDGGYTNEANGYAQTFMMYDIAALQAMYGANFNTNAGNTTYRWDAGTGQMFIDNVAQGAPTANRIFMTIWDGNGIDTYDFSNYATGLTVNLSPGAFSITSTEQTANLGNGNFAPGNIFNALQFNGDARSLIENATGGSGNDTITGNGAGNTLIGNDGTDTLNGDSGNDTLNGGGGADQLQGGSGTDFLYIDAADTLVDGGADYDYAFVLGAGAVSLNLVTSNLESAEGNAGNDVFNAAGAAYAVVLNGRGGADQLTGGSGGDTFNFDAADTVVQGGTGTDFAWAVTETAAVTVNLLAQGIEIAWGGAGGDTLNAAGVAVAVQIDGKDGNDVITGGSANNILIGNGGADQITGGAVGDQLFFDHLDTVVNGGGGFDYAFAHNAAGISVDYATQQIEAVFGGFQSDTLNASGMATTAYLLGNSGIDQLTGGAADDIVWFDHEDTVVQGGGGYNFAYAYNVGVSAVTMNLVTQQFDTAWGGFGDDALTAAGKATAVVLVGLGGADTLTGGNAGDTLSAGDGNDLLKGGGGNDTIFGEGGTGDISIYDGVAGDYSWTMIGANVYTVTHTASGAVDTIYNVESLRFTGGGPDVAI
jgi:serralysin